MGANRNAPAPDGGLPGDAGQAADMDRLALLLDSSDRSEREQARMALTGMGSAATRVLVAILAGERPGKGEETAAVEARWEAAKALRDMHDPVSAPALVAALQADSFDLRWLAAEAIIALGTPGMPPLLRALAALAPGTGADERSTWLAQEAWHVLDALAVTGLPAELRPVVEALEGPAPMADVARAAVEALASLTSPAGASGREQLVYRGRGRSRWTGRGAASTRERAIQKWVYWPKAAGQGEVTMVTIEKLQRIGVLAGLSPSQLVQVAEITEERTFGRREVIFHEDVAGKALYGLLEGQVIIEVEMTEFSQSMVDTAWPGEIFGWSAIVPPYSLQGEARSADFAHVLVIDSVAFRKLMAEDCEMGFKVMEQVAGMLAEKLRRTRVQNVSLLTMAA